MEKIKEILFLLVIMVIAVFARVWDLDSIPPGIWPDEAINGMQAIEEPGKLFYPENQGREGLMMWLNSLSFSFLGVSIFSFRIAPAIIGILTVLAVYLLAREMFRKRNAALMAAFFCATSFWHINFSRIDFRAILLPLVLCLAFYFLFLGIRKKNVWPQIGAGIFFGLGFYTYTTFRLSVLILAAALFFWRLKTRKEGCLKNFFANAAIMLATTFIVALPIGLYFVNGHMDQFFGRTGAVSVFGQPHPLNAFIESFWRHLGMFNIYGDPNWRHNYSGDPQLFWPVGLMFLAGWWVLAKNIKSFWQSKNWNALLPNAVLFIWFWAMILPAMLTYEGMPHCLRAIGVIPAVFILAGLGGNFLFEKLKEKIPSKKSVAAITAIILLFSGIMPIWRYFGDWASRPETARAFTFELARMGEFLTDNAPAGFEKVAVMYGGDLPARSVQLAAMAKDENDDPIRLIWPEHIESISADEKAVVLFMINNSQDINNFKQRFPDYRELATGQNFRAFLTN